MEMDDENFSEGDGENPEGDENLPKKSEEYNLQMVRIILAIFSKVFANIFIPKSIKKLLILHLISLKFDWILFYCRK